MEDNIEILTIDEIIEESNCDSTSEDHEEYEESETKSLEYVYLIREREFIRLGEDTFKIGKTTQTPNSRLSGYPKNSEVYLFEQTYNCGAAETLIIQRFDKQFECQHQYGREYYLGDVELMKIMIKHICLEVDYSVEKCINKNPTKKIAVIEQSDIVPEKQNITVKIPIKPSIEPIKNKRKEDIINLEKANIFINYIKLNTPDWYISNEWVDKQYLMIIYNQMFESKISHTLFNNLFKDKIFTESVRTTNKGVRSSKILLYSYDNIKTHV